MRARLREPPPGPFRPEFWRSPLRGPWLTSFLGTLLGPLIADDRGDRADLARLVLPGDRQQRDDQTPLTTSACLIHLPPSGPPWSYALTQGLHVTIGLVTIPVLLAKLWSVIPRLFAWPAVRSVAQALERGSLLLLVGGALFEFATGVLNIQNFYPWHFGFVRAHYYGAWVFFAAFDAARTRQAAGRRPGVPGARLAPAAARRSGAHAAGAAGAGRPRAGRAGACDAQSPRVARARRRGLADTVARQRRRDGRRSVAAAGAARPAGTRVRGSDPTISRSTALRPRSGSSRPSPGRSWRLSVSSGARSVSLTREQLLAMPQHTSRADDRVRRGLVDHPALERGAARRSRSARRRAFRRDLARSIDPAERAVPPRDAVSGPAARSAGAARACVSTAPTCRPTTAIRLA